jgi:alpha-D-ribose 1-methylphosphonate 5-triphosphate synthase subunit PhnH
MMSPDLLLPGFADPGAQSQNCFRAVLDAMAHPGRILSAPPVTPPPPLHPTTGAVLLTLLDGDTPVWLDEAVAASAPWLAFHCGVRLVDAARAAFAVACEMPALQALPPGSDVAPEAAATLILQVPALGRGTSYTLTGPGLPAPTSFRAAGLPADFVSQWHANHARFPMGIDLILCAPDGIAALPRSVEVA